MLILDDGTRAYLNTDTRLVVVKDPHRRGVSLETGEAMFDVAKDPHRPFVVSVGQQEVMALGTSFVVRRESAATSITLLEGKVAVSSPDVVSSPESERTLRATRDAAAVPLVAAVSTHDPVYTLAPGQRLILAENRQAKLDEPALEKITAWRRGEVVLDKTRLQDAANEMNRYSDVKLTVADPRVADIRVSGIFRVGDSVRFARAVSETYHLTLTSDESSIVIH